MNFKFLVAFLLLSFSFGERVWANIEVESSDPAIRSQAITFFSQELQGEVSRSKIADAIRKFYLGKSIYLVQVFVNNDVQPPNFRIVIQLKPRIAGIEFLGNKRLSDSDLLSRVDITAGDPIAPDEIPELERKISEYYAYRGYRSAKVEVNMKNTSVSGQVKLEVVIREGNPCKWKEINLVVEDRVVSDLQAKSLFPIKVGGRCDIEQLSKEIKGVERSFRNQKYLSVSLSEPNIFWDEEKRLATFELHLKVGPKIQIQFFGNTFFFERDHVLAQAIGLQDERRFNKNWIESTAVDGLERFYRSKGYPEAKITVKDRSYPEQNLRQIQLHIYRKAKWRLSKIHFDGNRYFSQSKLRKTFESTDIDSIHDGAYVAEDVELAAQNIIALYQSEGFLRTTIESHQMRKNPRTQEIDVKFVVNEGEQTRIGKLIISGNHFFTDRKISSWMGLKEGMPLNPSLLIRAQDVIAEKYREQGYKFITVKGPALESIPTGTYDYPMQIDEGEVVKFGDITIKGNLNTEDYVIRRELEMAEGDIYSPEKIRGSRRKLLRLGFFQQISIEESTFDPETQREDIIVTVRERKKRSVRIRPGFSTDEGARGAVDLAYLNIAGTGRSASISTQVSRRVSAGSIIQHNEVFTYREPKMFNFMDGRFNFINERSEERQFDIDRRSIILGVDRDWSHWLRTSLQWELEFRNPFNIAPSANLSPFDEAAARFGSLSTILDFDFRNDFLNPTKGTFHRLKFDVYNGSLLSDADFAQVYVRNTFYIPIYKRIRMVTALRAGFSATYGKTRSSGIAEIPIEKRFRLGGGATLRGFSQNCVGVLNSTDPEQCNNDPNNQAPGGNAVFNYMTDLLLPLYGGLDFAIFTDGGNAYLENSQFDPTNIRTTAGVGLRYNTFFGPIRFDVGFKLDRRVGENLTEIHFAVGQF